jgi:DNA-binding MarR family transcriptional regulator
MAKHSRANRTETVFSQIHRLSNRIGRVFKSELESNHGLSIAEWRVLMTLAQHPGAGAPDIGEHWAMDKMMVNRAIRGLADAGHLRRKTSAGDRRRHDLVLSAKGKRLYERVLPDAAARYREIVATLDKEELAELRVSLEKLLTRASELSDECRRLAVFRNI